MLVVGIILLVLGTLVFLGHINLISESHTENIKKEQQKMFCHGVGAQLIIGSLGMVIAGILSLIFREEAFFLPSILIAFIPLLVSIVSIFIYIKMFNGKIMS